MLPDPETHRLTFHRHASSDYADSAALWADPATVRYISAQPSTPEDSWSRLLRNVGHWHIAGFGVWVVRDRASGRFVGEVGMKLFRRSLNPDWDSLPECGWVLANSAQGKGLATEAVTAALAWGDRHFAWPSVICMINPSNDASLRVAAKCGFAEFSRATYHATENVLFRRVLPGSDAREEHASF